MSAFPRAGNTGNGWSPAPPSARGRRVEVFGRPLTRFRRVLKFLRQQVRGLATPRSCRSYLLMRKKEEKPVIQVRSFLILSGKRFPVPDAIDS
jgi:hypothetical protein